MDPICTICLEPFGYVPTSATVCGHLYHEPCVTRWLETHATCPECRNASPGPLRTVHLDFVGPTEEEVQLYNEPDQDGRPPRNARARANFDFLMERSIELRSALYAMEQRKAAKERKTKKTKLAAENILGKRKTADTLADDGGEGSSDQRQMPTGAQGGRTATGAMVTEEQENDSSEGETIPNSEI